LTEAERLGAKSAADSYADPPDGVRLAIVPLDRVHIRSDRYSQALAAPGHLQVHRPSRTALQHGEQVVPLLDRSMVHSGDGVTHLDPRFRCGAPWQDLADDRNPIRLQSLGSLEPRLERVGMDRKRHG